MKTSNFVLSTFTFLLFSLTCCAQPPGGDTDHKRKGPPPIPSETQIEKMVNELSTAISLSETQEKNISAMHKEHFMQMKQITNSKNKPSREQMKAHKDSFMTEVKSQLTPEQITKFDLFMKERKLERKKRRE